MSDVSNRRMVYCAVSAKDAHPKDGSGLLLCDCWLTQRDILLVVLALACGCNKVLPCFVPKSSGQYAMS